MPGRLEPAQDASRSMVPASMATLISIPTPQIMMMVFHGTLSMTCFWGARFMNRPITEKMIATRPTSILALMKVMSSTSGRTMWRIGKISTTTSMATIRYRFSFCFFVKGSGFWKDIPWPMFRLLLGI